MSLNHDNMINLTTPTLTILLSAGVTSGIWGFLTDFAVPIGSLATTIIAAVTLGTFLVNWYFKKAENTRKNAEEARKSILFKKTISGDLPDKIEGSDNVGIS